MEEIQGITVYRKTAGNRRFGFVVYIMVSVSTSLMILSMMLTDNVLVNMIVLIGSMYIAMALLVYRVKWVLNEDGITEILEPYTSRIKLLRKKSRFLPWSKLDSYKLDHDMTKFSGDMWFLNLYFKDPNYKINIIEGTKDDEKADFHRAKDYFLSVVESVNVKATQPVAAPYMPVTENASGNIIKKRKSFYETRWAILFLAILGFFIVWMLWFILSPVEDSISDNSLKNLSRILFFLVPGALYIYYRILQARRKKEITD